MITNINKLTYDTLIGCFLNDKKKILNSLSLKKSKIVLGNNKSETTILSSTGNWKYIVRTSGNIIAVYSILPEHLIIWPISIITDENSHKYVILVKIHAIERYGERYLEETNPEKQLDSFIDQFCLCKDPILIKRSETDKVDSLMCRIKYGALLGYRYKVNPNVLRFNTFVSDTELNLAEREDQKDIRVGSKIWEQVQ